MKEKYGEWIVLSPSPDKKYYSRCKCSCGVIKDVKNSSLKLGKSKSCGHTIRKAIRERKYKELDEKILNKRFGRLIAKERATDSGVSKYLCECDCGNEIIVGAMQLLGEYTKSCGCIRQENSSERMKKIMEQGHEKLKEGVVEGTSIYTLDQKISKNNKTGIKGVSKTKDGRYRAYINLKRKQKYLGTFDTLDEAQEARLQAEEELYDPIIGKYIQITEED